MDNVNRNENIRSTRQAESLLGLQDFLLDGLSDCSLNENVSVSSADLQLQFQRALAESFLQKSNCQHDRSTTSVLSDSHITFQEKDLSGQSTPRDNSSCQRGNVSRNLDMKVEEDLEALFEKYSGGFIPAEEAVHKFAQDEQDRKNEFRPGICEKLDFSGVTGDDEVSVSSSISGGNSSGKKKLGIEEYFALKTNSCGYLQTSPSHQRRPNFGSDIMSPVCNRPQIALVDLPANDVSASEDQPRRNSQVVKSKTDTEMKFRNSQAQSSISFIQQTLSLTGINDVLSEHYQDSPPTIARHLMNPRKSLKPPQTKGLHCETQISSKTVAEGSKNDWVKIEMPVKLDTYLGSKANLILHLRNQSSRWLRCNITATNVTCDEKIQVEQDKLAEILLPDLTLLGPNNSTDQMVTVLPVVMAPLTVELHLCLEDAVTKAVQAHTRRIECTVRLPKVKFSVDGKSTDEVNFGILPDTCSSSKRVGIVNVTDEKIPWVFEVEEVSPIYKTFFMKVKNGTDSEESSSQFEDPQIHFINVVFRAPSVENKEDMEDELLHFTAYLNVSVEIADKSCLIHKLKLTGSVARCKLLLNFKSPIVLVANSLSEPVSGKLLMKNDSVIPLNLNLMIAHPELWDKKDDDVISVDNPVLCIGAGRETAVTVTFTPDWTFEEVLKRVLFIQVQPDGKVFETDIHCLITCKQANTKKRLSSQSSGSTETKDSRTSSEASGRVFGSGLPVRTTHRELVWGTVVVGKTVKQSYRLQNQWPHSVKIVLNLVDPTHSYRLHNSDGDSVMEYTVKLMPKECVGVNISFHPSKVGPARGKVTMCHTRGVGERFAIPLYGFGGGMKLCLRNIPYDKAGQMWLNLGQIDRSMHSQFMIQNKGSVAAFAFCTFNSKDLGHLTQWNVEIQPSKLVIGPGCTENIRLKCCVKGDTSFMIDDDREVMEIGILHISYGDEPTRYRIRRIRDKKRGETKGNDLLKSLDNLCCSLPGEAPIPDINLLDDPESSLRILYRSLQRYEISLNVDRSCDRSLAMQTCIDDGNNVSSLFKSVITDNTITTSINDIPDAAWSVMPCVITLLPPQYPGACFTITNNYKDDQMFEVSSSESWLSIEPATGIISSMGETLVGVTCSALRVNATTPVTATLKVFVENDMKTITVNIKHTMEKSTPANRCQSGIK